MRKKRSKIFVILGVSAVLLVGLIAVQISWFLHVTDLHEQQFKNKLANASHLIRYQIWKDKALNELLTCQIKENNGRHLKLALKQQVREKLGKFIASELSHQEVKLPYTFELVDKKNQGFGTPQQDKVIVQPVDLEKVLERKKNREKRTLKAEIRLFMPNNRWARTGQATIIFIAMLVFTLGSFAVVAGVLLRQKKRADANFAFFNSLNDVSQELKTPISTVALASNMLRKEKVLTNRNKVKHYSGVIYEENKKIEEKVTTRILDKIPRWKSSQNKRAGKQ